MKLGRVLLSLFLALSLPLPAMAAGGCSSCGPFSLPVLPVILSTTYTNATTTFSNTALSVTVTTGKRYIFEASLFASDSTALDGSKLDFNGGTATVSTFAASCLLYNAVGTPLVQAAAVSAALATPLNIAALTDTATHSYLCTGGFVASASGTFILRGAQNAHTAGTLSILAGSFLLVQEVP